MLLWRSKKLGVATAAEGPAAGANPRASSLGLTGLFLIREKLP